MSKTDTVSPLRQRMIEDMAARKLNPHTQRSHIYSCKRFAAWLKRSPDTATLDEVRLVPQRLAVGQLPGDDEPPEFVGDQVFNFWQDATHVRGIWRRTSVDSFRKDCLIRGADEITMTLSYEKDIAAFEARWPAIAKLDAVMKPGALAIECSTVSHAHALDMARELRSRGLIYIDCPVTGLPAAAASGKLTLLVGADAADLEKAQLFLAPLCASIRHFGAVGSGTEFKLINNLMGAVQIASLAEGVAMAEQAGLDMKLVAEALALFPQATIVKIETGATL